MIRADRAVGRFLLVSLVLPAIVVLAAVAVQLVALPSVPGTIAIHWNAAGVPDSFAPSWLQPVLTVVFGLGLPALIASTSLPGLRRGDRGASYRLMGAVACALAVLIAVLTTATLVLQAGPEGSSTPLRLWPTVVIAFAVTVLAGVAAWFAQPAGEAAAAAPAPAEPLALEPGERAMWLRTASIARGGAIAITLAAIVVSSAAVLTWTTGAPVSTAWVVTGVAVLLIVLAATTVTFHVLVDERGLSVDSVAGFPRFRVPLAEVAAVAAVEVVPMGEFGGWGLRWAPGRRFGVVLRSGSAIEVTRRDGRRFVVTVDDARTGAALLEALAEREASTRS